MSAQNLMPGTVLDRNKNEIREGDVVLVKFGINLRRGGWQGVVKEISSNDHNRVQLRILLPRERRVVTIPYGCGGDSLCRISGCN